MDINNSKLNVSDDDLRQLVIVNINSVLLDIDQIDVSIKEKIKIISLRSENLEQIINKRKKTIRTNRNNQ